MTRPARLATIAAVAALALASLAARPPASVADEPDPALPSPADLMQLTQIRQFKLWYAVRAGNWPLADYEVKQFDRTVRRIAALYPEMVSSASADIARKEADRVRAAIEARDSAAFTEAFRALTNGCNACHRDEGLDFIRVRVPTSSPFSNQDMHVAE